MVKSYSRSGPTTCSSLDNQNDSVMNRDLTVVTEEKFEEMMSRLNEASTRGGPVADKLAVTTPLMKSLPIRSQLVNHKGAE